MEFTKSCSATLLAAVLAVILTPYVDGRLPAADNRGEAPVVAQGILVQPDASALEPPAIADQQDDDGDDDSGEEVPPAIAPSPGVIQVVPAVPESRQEELERPGRRQEDTERGDRRQEELEMPGGPGIKY
jgi:hypothetical protein